MASSKGMAVTTALAVLLALCVAPYAPGGVPLVVAAKAPASRYAEAREAWRPKVPKPKRGASPHQKETEERRPNRSDRRVIPWVSVAILVIILFFFRSFAAPFFDPLVRCDMCAIFNQLVNCHSKHH